MINPQRKFTLVFIFISVSFSAFSQTKQQPNILFIAIDDLKPDLGCYGFTAVKSPNIDKLANTATLFAANYCQQAVCAPTRASLLTGLRPDKTKVWDLKTLIRNMNPNIVTMPQYFKDNGYITAALGKVFDQRSVDKQHDKISWSIPYKKENTYVYPAAYGSPAMGHYQSVTFKKSMPASNSNTVLDEDDAKNGKKLVSTECIDVPDDVYADGMTANEAIIDLKDFAKLGKPFFLAVGFHKPHLPFVAPQKYWDLYDRSKIELAKWQQPSIDGPEIAYHTSGELRNFSDIEPIGDGNLLKLSDDKQRELIHGYYACISYTDALVGKLMAALKASGLDKNTIVVLWGDHGWHLGDHSLWNKHSNFEQATKAPLIISTVGQTKKYTYKNPTEFVDIFPTLCDLVGLKIPEGLDGVSLAAATAGSKAPVKEFSISQWPKNLGNPDKATMGYTLRTSRYRYTEWVGQDFRSTKAYNPAAVTATELYDYETDPNETHNLINNSKCTAIKKELAGKMHIYFKRQEIKQ